MSFEVETVPPFEKSFKRILRKYPSLTNDVLLLVKSLEETPVQGTPLGNDFYKIRVAISSKGKGKSGGARVITLVKIIQEKVFLAAIYDKSVQASITNKELKLLAKIISDKL